jgi:outer membrane biosynthesis protein TonB
MEINITLDVQGATVEEVQWLAGLLAAQRTAPAPITVEVEKAAPTAPADEEKPAKKTAKKSDPEPEPTPEPAPADEEKPAKKTAKKSDPEPEPTPEPAPAEDETGGATVEDETVTPEADLLAVAVARATELIGAGEQDAIKTALEVAGARRVGLLKGDQIQAFLDALPEA